MNRRIEMAHDRGLNFTIGIWDYVYRGGVQGPRELTEKPTPGIVWGLTADNLVPYTKVALREFLERVPQLDAIRTVGAGYRNASGKTHTLALNSPGPLLYRGVIPAKDVTGRLTYFLEATDTAGHPTTWPAAGMQEPAAVKVTDHHSPPTVTHAPITTALEARPLTITAPVHDPNGLRWVRLRYRRVSQHFDYRTLAMQSTGKQNQYAATVPAEAIVPAWGFMYFIEVMDTCGNGKIFPDFHKATPYVVVRLDR